MLAPGMALMSMREVAFLGLVPIRMPLVAGDAEEIAEAFEQAAKINGPVYIRVAREPMPIRDKSAVPRVTDIAAIANSGNDFAIIFEGTVLEQATDGYYEIANAGNLCWFANLVNGENGNAAANARLMCDVDMSAVTDWLAISSQKLRY